MIVLLGLGMGFRQVMYFSMLADCVDYGEWKSRRNLAGTQGVAEIDNDKINLIRADGSLLGRALPVCFGT